MAYSTDSGSDLGLMENTSDEKLIEVYSYFWNVFVNQLFFLFTFDKVL